MTTPVVHKQMHQRTGEQEQIGEYAEEIYTMFGKRQKEGD
jgi:hypothetical protein